MNKNELLNQKSLEFHEKHFNQLFSVVERAKILHTVLDEIIESYNLLADSIAAELPDSTKEMLQEIISWEKDLSEYKALETILKDKYIISKR
jgi:hypothetical protein